MSATPLYCPRCGMRYVRRTATYDPGYDMYDGSKLPVEEFATLECPSDQGHERWEFRQMTVTKDWVKP